MRHSPGLRLALCAAAAALAPGVPASAATLTVGSTQLEAGGQGFVSVRASRKRCGLTFTSPDQLRTGTYRVSMRGRNYASWSWTLPAGVRAGAWRADVRCTGRGKPVKGAATFTVLGSPTDTATLVAPGSMAARSARSFPDPGNKGAGPANGGYPDAGAVCKWANGGPNCRSGDNWYDWGYKRGGTFALLSSRGFAFRNCTDFVAWKLNLTWGQFKFPGSGTGHAKNWKAYAANAGLTVTGSPSVGDVAWFARGSFGHVAVVTAVHPNGTVDVEQYNRHARGEYSIETGIRADAYLHRPGAAPTTPPQTTTPPTTTSDQPSTTPPTTDNPITPPQTTPAARVNAYDNYGNDGVVGRPMCRGFPGTASGMPGGTTTQTFTVPAGVASIDTALVAIDPDARVTAHSTLLVNGQVRATAAAAAGGDTRFTYPAVRVAAGDQVTLSISFTATYGKFITVYTIGYPGGTFTASNSCSGGGANVNTTSTGMKAQLAGWNQ